MNQTLYFLFLLVWTGLILGHGHGADVSRVEVKEGDDVVLPCSLDPRENLLKTTFYWLKDDHSNVFLFEAGKHSNNGLPGQDQQFKGRVSIFDEELKNSNASIKIHNTKIEDRGNYTCQFPIHDPVLRSTVELVVYAAVSPNITVVNSSEAGVLLQCELQRAFPKPQVEWQDSDGNVLPAQEPQVTFRRNRYDVILLIAVTKTTTNRFRCVVKETINHETEADVTVPEELFKSRDATSLVTGWITASVVVAAVAVVAAVVFVWIKKRKKNNGSEVL